MIGFTASTLAEVVEETGRAAMAARVGLIPSGRGMLPIGTAMATERGASRLRDSWEEERSDAVLEFDEEEKAADEEDEDEEEEEPATLPK